MGQERYTTVPQAASTHHYSAQRGRCHGLRSADTADVILTPWSWGGAGIEINGLAMDINSIGLSCADCFAFAVYHLD